MIWHNQLVYIHLYNIHRGFYTFLSVHSFFIQCDWDDAGCGCALTPSGGQTVTLLCSLLRNRQTVLSFLRQAAHISETPPSLHLKIQPWVRVSHSYPVEHMVLCVYCRCHGNVSQVPFFPHLHGVWRLPRLR